MSRANANRTDMGFYVLRHMVMRAGTTPGYPIGAVAYLSGELLARFPTAAHELANHLNRAAGLPEIALPTEEGFEKPADRRAG